ncbi:hypothetical protein NE237_003271 [Protea cynaroides]|uniref:Uncharacterized protein n=1 Tax=Protea cynaroides TaxID=273540 RepID=A0A9Q0KGN1_9MAGN|nr:hypothetical protein NE237_003271 [Protea cynaroides]
MRSKTVSCFGIIMISVNERKKYCFCRRKECRSKVHCTSYCKCSIICRFGAVLLFFCKSVMVAKLKNLTMFFLFPCILRAWLKTARKY